MSGETSDRKERKAEKRAERKERRDARLKDESLASLIWIRVLMWAGWICLGVGTCMLFETCFWKVLIPEAVTVFGCGVLGVLGVVDAVRWRRVRGMSSGLRVRGPRSPRDPL